MRFINIVTDTPRDEIVSVLRNYEAVNEKVVFDDRNGKPTFKVKEKKNMKIGMTCEMVGGATKDNGFLVGTYLSAKLYEKDGKTHLRGFITTAPIYHLILLLLTAFFVYQCIKHQGFTPVPIILLAFNYFLFRREYKKQGLIQRYIFRAVSYAEKRLPNPKSRG